MKEIYIIFCSSLILFMCCAGLHQAHSQKQTQAFKNPQVPLDFVADSIAFLLSEKILIEHPRNAESLNQASYLASRLTGSTSNPQRKELYIKMAVYYAQQSIEIEPRAKEAHLNYIIALGLLSEIEKNPSEKLRHANVIKGRLPAIHRFLIRTCPLRARQVALIACFSFLA